MCKIKVLVVIFMAMFLMLPTGLFAQEFDTTAITATTADGTPVQLQIETVDTLGADPLVIAPVVDEGSVSYEDLGVEKPKHVPSRFGFWWQGVKQKADLAFTFNKVKKAEKELHYINQGMAHAKNILENSDNQGLKNAATKRIELTAKLSEKWKNRVNNWKVEDGEVMTKVEQMTELYLAKELKHQQLLEHLQTKVPPQAMEKIKAAQESRLGHLKEVFEKTKPKISAKFKDQVKKLK